MNQVKSIGGSAPELLAPAGNWECVHAAIENGADAIYFGLEVGFNARARAANFSTEDLPHLMSTLHRRGVSGYVTLNTLIFTDELAAFEENVRQLAQAGVDAVLVQDIGAVRLIREICPELAVHASTQMTMVSAETIRAIEELGIQRVVLARELSIGEIRKITSATKMPVEAFIHGALCVAYSGQCLTSESLGGRSANRGQCAQACRLNYDLICDGQDQNLGDNKYLLSPQDLAGYEHVPAMIEAGVCSLKIEGRLKTPEYVANIVGHYRRAIDDAMLGKSVRWNDSTKREMELSFSRGFSPGWLDGCNHKRLVPGLSSAKKGVAVGKVLYVKGERVGVELDAPLMQGDGVVFEGNRLAGEEVGGRIFQVFDKQKQIDTPAKGRLELAFQRGLIRNADLRPGQILWQTDSPQLTKKLRATFDSKQPRRKTNIGIRIRVHTGKSIEVQANIRTCPPRLIEITSPFIPPVAMKHSVTETSLMDQLNRLGNTPFQIDELIADIEGNPMVPLSILGEIRKEIVMEAERSMVEVPPRTIHPEIVHARMLSQVETAETPTSQGHCTTERETDRAASANTIESPVLHVLVRSLEQLKQVIQLHHQMIYVDFHDIRQYATAVSMAKEADAKIFIATLRIQKPGEYGLFKALEKRDADGWLVRNLAALDYARNASIPCVADFSLNVTNPLTAQWLVQKGASRVTASYDLNRDQLNELVRATPSSWMEVVVHQHMPMFHMEHCVFCTVLSPGFNKSNCGRPCDRHDVKLRDRLGFEHTLHADVGCRNTLYNGQAQSGAEATRNLIQSGIRHFRIELLRDLDAGSTEKILTLYRELLDGKRDGAEVWKELKAANRLGVTRGTLEHPRNPLAIL